MLISVRWAGYRSYQRYTFIVLVPMWFPCVNSPSTLWLCQNSYWKWPLIVDLHIDSMVIFQFANCKRLPEGNTPHPNFPGSQLARVTLLQHALSEFFWCLTSKLLTPRSMLPRCHVFLCWMRCRFGTGIGLWFQPDLSPDIPRLW